MTLSKTFQTNSVILVYTTLLSLIYALEFSSLEHSYIQDVRCETVFSEAGR